MRKFSAYLLFIALAAATFACNKPVADKNTQNIDSLVDVLSAAKKAVQAIDIEALNKDIPQYDAYYDFFLTEYNDTSQREFYTHQLDDMMRCRKYTKKTVQNVDIWEQEIDKTLNQLKTLKHDYAHGLIEKSDFDKNYTVEWTATYNANQNIQKYVGLASACQRNFEDLSRQLDSARTAFKNAND